MIKNSTSSGGRRQDGSTGLRSTIAKISRWIGFAFLGLLTFSAHAAGEWIDEFPNVPLVAHAVSDQLKADTVDWNFSMRGIALKDDDDLFSVYMVGTLVMLRQIILYKYEQEEKSLSKQDVEKLRLLVASYLEAELVIGKSTGKRRGYLTTAQKCRDLDCHYRWFKMHYMSVNGAAYRERILPRMFCDDERAMELQKLALSVGIKAPYLPSPAVTLEVEKSMAGVAPPGCSPYGGDKDNNGLCDDWQPRPLIGPIDKSSMNACLQIERPDGPVFWGGKREVSNRWMEVRTGVSGRQGDICEEKKITIKDCDTPPEEHLVHSGGGCGIKDGISIRVKCASGHVVQFISREYWKRGGLDPETQAADSNLETGRYGIGPYTHDSDNPDVLVATCHEKTSNLKERKWHTDSQVKYNPSYDSGGSYVRSRNCMTTLDAPNAPFDPEKYLVVRIVGKSFAICECEVKAVVDWERAYYAGAPKTKDGQTIPEYKVQTPREPTAAEIKQFQDLSAHEGFEKWPPEGNCNKCER